MEGVIQAVLYQYDYGLIYLLTVLYFALLYFGIGFLFLQGCKFLAAKKILSVISPGAIEPRQTRFEVLHSIQSILIFGFSSLPIIYLIRNAAITLIADSLLHVATGLLILSLWNELHFFVVHRIMHTRFFMQRVHVVHHRSKISTVYAVFSFHWLEALLLSTVPLTIVPFISFAPLAIFLYPLASILLNFAGHCNYRFGKGTSRSWLGFATGHNKHHYKNAKRYGFALSIFDKLFSPDHK
ncbi:MAG: sterol desaturase family protein [Bacteroidota bacterium]